MATEQDLENLLASHPYILDREFGRRRPIRQLQRGRSRLDLLFHLRAGYCVVELKKTPLSHFDVRQIARYCRLLQKEGLVPSHHYLVGFRPPNLKPIEKELRRHSFQIRLRFLGEDIPLTVLWDAKKREYVRFQTEISYLGECLHLRF